MAGKFSEISKLICVQCGAYDSFLWRSSDDGQICNKCLLANPNGETKCDTDEKKEEDKDGVERKSEKKRKRSARHKSKTLTDSASKSNGNEEGDHKNIFERPVTAPTASATVVTSDCIFFRVNKIIINCYVF